MNMRQHKRKLRGRESHHFIPPGATVYTATTWWSIPVFRRTSSKLRKFHRARLYSETGSTLTAEADIAIRLGEFWGMHPYQPVDAGTKTRPDLS